MTRSKRWHACGLGVAMVAIGIILSTAVYWFLLSNARRGPLLQSVTPDSVWVLWDTPQPEIGQIEYGTSPAFGQTITQAKAERHHELQITGLNPYTRYYYHITGFSPANFRTAAAAGQGGFRFAVLGDTRENLSVHRAS